MFIPLALLLTFVQPCTDVELLTDIHTQGFGVGANIKVQPSGVPIQTALKYGEPAMVDAGGRWFFSAQESTYGRELYSTDGTASGTQRLTDTPLGDWFGPRELATLAGRLYFSIDDGVHGLELWTSDGTAAGTQMLVDLRSGPLGSDPREFTELNGQLFFQAADSSGDIELWRTDGTPDGTVQVADLDPTGSSRPHDFGLDPAGSALYFAATVGTQGAELWRTDGTQAGTRHVADLNPLGSSSPRFFTTVGQRTVFVASNLQGGSGIWVTDGTSPGTFMLPGLTVATGADALDAALVGGVLYMSVHAGVGPTRIWRTDGTLAGTQQVWNGDAAGAGKGPSDLVELGGELYFLGSGPGQFDGGLFHFDGQTASKVSSPSAFHSNASGPLVVSGESLYYVGVQTEGERALYVSDTQGANTWQVAPPAPPLSGALEALTPDGAGGLLYAGWSESTGAELFATSGAPNSGTLVVELQPVVITGDADPLHLRSFDGQRLFFAADDGLQGRDPWVWTPGGGAQPLGDWNGDTPTSSTVGESVESWVAGAALILIHVGGDGLFASDGTVMGTYELEVPGWHVSFADTRSAIGDGAGLYFVAVVQSKTTFKTVSHLFFTQGTPETTWPVGDADVFSVFGTVGALPGRAFARGQEEATGSELYVTDGSPGSAALLLDINLGPYDSVPYGWAAIGERGFFTATEPTRGRSVWVTDGTAVGTQPFVDVWPGAGSADEYKLWAWGERLLIQGVGPDGSGHLWSVDTNSADPQSALNDLGAMEVGWLPVGQDGQVMAVDGELYYVGVGAGSVPQLMRTDGTAAGTAQVDLAPGIQPITELLPANGGVYFVGYEAGDDKGLFFTDGTAVGTVQVGAESGISNPSGLTLLAGDLIFAADHYVHGRELFRATQIGASVQPLSGGAPGGARLSASTPRLGTPVQIEAAGWPVGHLAALFTSLPATEPTVLLTDPLHASWLDPASLHLWILQGLPDIQLSVTVPPNPGLAGLQVTAQVFHGPSIGLPASTSNALRLTFAH